MTSPSQSSSSHFSPSRMASMASLVERSRSVSSIRSSILPPRFLAYSQLNSAVRAPPMWRKPVGEGAKRVTTGVLFILERRSHLGRFGLGPCTRHGDACHGIIVNGRYRQASDVGSWPLLKDWTPENPSCKGREPLSVFR